MTKADALAAEIAAQRLELDQAGTPANLIILGAAAHLVLRDSTIKTRGGNARLSIYAGLPVFIRGDGLSVSVAHKANAPRK